MTTTAPKRLGTPKVLTYLKGRDARLARVIDRVGACRLVPRAEGSHFTALARAIVFQQLSGKAASTIYGRFAALAGGDEPTPARLNELSDEALRGVGLSRQKLGYLRDLARHAEDGHFERLHELPDEEIIAEVTAVKGVGVWTAQMFLMFRLGRPDVLPVLDLGIKKGVQKVYGLRKLPDAKKIEGLAEPWRPYRTVACWYLWRSLES
jgi:DNA-3-methyladenine glycosylase II